MATKRYGAGPRHSITSPVKVHSVRPVIGDVPIRRGRGSIPEVGQSHGRTRVLMPRLARLRACTGGQRAQCRSMMHDNELAPVPSDHPVAHADRLRLAAAAYLARFKGTSRDHADSGLRCYLTWCADRGLDPFQARRPHLELYIRWMQEVRRFKPS